MLIIIFIETSECGFCAKKISTRNDASDREMSATRNWFAYRIYFCV